MALEDPEKRFRQFLGIKFSVKRGYEYKRDYPEIAQLYRDGYTASQICDEMGIEPIKTNLNAVLYALRGNSNPGYGKIYEGLIPEDESSVLGLRNKSTGGQRGGAERVRRCIEEGLAPIPFTPEELSRYGKRGGNKNLEKRLGIHGLSGEETIKNARKGAETRGFTIMNPEELEFIQSLLEDPSYYHQPDSHPRYRGKPDYKKIKDILEEDLGIVRRRETLATLIKRKFPELLSEMKEKVLGE
jgi:hypothetical protein